ncbi:MAG: hypothetical protein ABIV50_04555 [Opitutus sp.]
MNADAEPENRKFELKPKPYEKVNAPISAESSEPIKVESILRDNLAVRETSRPLVLDLNQKMPRRKRDYLILLIGGNALLLLGISFLPKDPLLHTLGYSALGLYSVALTWLMWAVMDSY